MWQAIGNDCYRCDICGLVTAPTKSPPTQIHHRCKSTAQAPPSLAKRAVNFTIATIEHICCGAPTCTQEEIDRRFAVCQRCELLHPQKQVCTHKSCGCAVSDKKKWFSKLGWHDQRCPLGKWEAMEEHLKLLEAALVEPLPEPTWDADRGIVIGAGGAKFFQCAWAVVSVLRELGCRLPIQFSYLGRAEMDPHMLGAAKSVGIECVDATAVAASLPRPPRILNGWELKPFSVLHSRFREVLFLDADSVPTRDPTYLFDSPEFKRHGAIFWPDLPPYDRKEWLPDVVWRNCGMKPRDEVDFESGQFLIDRARCWRELNVTMHMNEHSDWYYKFVYGDKSTYHLAWRKCGSDYAIPSKPAGWRHPAIIQHDFSGRVLFQHACRGKEPLAAGEKIPVLTKSEACIRAANALRHLFSGSIWKWQPSALASACVGKYRYRRIGLDERDMVLADDGHISKGNAKCEKRWAVYDLEGEPTLVIVGEAHKGSEIGMMLLRWRDGAWRGRWESFERCEIELKPELPIVGLSQQADVPLADQSWFISAAGVKRVAWSCLIDRAGPRISYCVYGQKLDYIVGALHNATLVQKVYPGWVPRFYIEAATRLRAALCETGCEVVVMDDAYVQHGPHPMAWRLFALADPRVTVAIFRDADSLPNDREKQAVEAWLRTSHEFHRMKERDHIPGPPIQLGMFGARRTIPNIIDLVEQFSWCDRSSKPPIDTPFATKMLWPLVIDNCLFHGVADDAFGQCTPFPQHDPIVGFVGARHRDGVFGF